MILTLSKTVCAAALALLPGLSAQHIRTKADPSADGNTITTYRLRPGFIHGRHPRLDDAALRQHIESALDERARAVGLRVSNRPDVDLTYSLIANDDKDVERRQGKRKEFEATKYELEIRMLDASGKTVWTAICTGSIRDRRQKYVEPRLLRAITLAMARFR